MSALYVFHLKSYAYDGVTSRTNGQQHKLKKSSGQVKLFGGVFSTAHGNSSLHAGPGRIA